MANFETWERATLEQFAREATAKLVENKALIDGLAEALQRALPIVRDHISAAIKHESTPTKEQ